MELVFLYVLCFFFVKQKTAYEMRISDWSSDVCSSDLVNWLIALPALALVAILAADWVTIAAYVAPMLLWLLLAIGALVIGALVVLPTKSREGQAADRGAVGPLAEFFSREGAILILFFLLLHKQIGRAHV